MKPGLTLRASQHLALTPQLQQSIRLLQLSTLELEQEVEQMLNENPFLERATEEAEREAFGIAQSDALPSHDEVAATANTSAVDEPDGAAAAERALDWEGDGTHTISPDDSEWGGEAPARVPPSDQREDANRLMPQQETLQMHLLEQARTVRIHAVDRAALEFLIGSLNEDGYLEDTLEALVQALLKKENANELQREELLHHFTIALHWLHQFTPVGVGARDLSACLRLQLLALKQSEAVQSDSPKATAIATALLVCACPLQLLARRDVRHLMSLCGASESAIKEALTLIATLEPKPGRQFASVERNMVVPDVFVVPSRGETTGKFYVYLNTETMPRLRIHDLYAAALSAHKTTAATGLQQHLQEARWFIKNIQQRFDTILRVSKSIVQRQQNFLSQGPLAMRPLVLREIAEELGLHESTVSRVTSAKYMETPLGTFELKYFFGSGLTTEAGDNTSGTAVRALLKQFISNECARKPLSDHQLSEMLKEQGILCARRTVAKYREVMRIAPTHLRKVL